MTEHDINNVNVLLTLHKVDIRRRVLHIRGVRCIEIIDMIEVSQVHANERNTWSVDVPQILTAGTEIEIGCHELLKVCEPLLPFAESPRLGKTFQDCR